MIKLYQYRTAWGLPNPSPFCTKAQTILRMLDVPYEIAEIDDPRGAPKGKLPYIEDGSTKVADSSLIADYLQKSKGVQLDEGLNPAQRATSHAARKMLEEHLYFALMYSRWVDPGGWKIVGPGYFGHLPAVVKWFLPEILRKGVVKTLHAQGIGRHTPSEIYDMGNRDLTALSDLLGSEKFFFGDKPSHLDAVAFSFCVNIERVPIDNPMTRHYKSLPNLIAHTARMHERYFKKS